MKKGIATTKPGTEEVMREISEQESAESEGALLAVRDASGKQILVVEDDFNVVELIRDIVALLGFEVIVAENAEQALDKFEQCSDSALCVILDYGIPGMDASRLLSRLREIDAKVKVLLSSGYSRSFIAKEFPLESVDGFIPKPYEPQLLVEALNKVVNTAQ